MEDKDMKQFYDDGAGRLRFNDEYVGPISLPKRVTTCDYMFAKCHVKFGCYLANFDTSSVRSMDGMFAGAKLPAGFGLGVSFDTSKVTDMRGMFNECCVAGDFVLGDKFDTTNVTNMEQMFHGFQNVSAKKPFSLGEKFDTSKITDMSYMFAESWFGCGLDLGKKFNTESVECMCSMFRRLQTFTGDLRLGDSFKTAQVYSMERMFEDLHVDNLCLGNEFDTSNVEDFSYMFADAQINSRLDLGPNFHTEKAISLDAMFKDATVCKSFNMGGPFKVNKECSVKSMFSMCFLPKDFVFPKKFKPARDKVSDDTFAFYMEEGANPFQVNGYIATLYNPKHLDMPDAEIEAMLAALEKMEMPALIPIEED